MNSKELQHYWEGNAAVWTKLSREGCDVCRDLLNSPAFLRMLPDINGLHGLDIGCGEGSNTRLLAGQGAWMTALDLAPTFIEAAQEKEFAEPLGISYQLGDAEELPFEDDSFDFLTAFMSLMDLSDQRRVFAEARRVLKPGGWLQFSITHPCFSPPIRYWINDDDGKQHALAVGDYFRHTEGEVEQWIFSRTPKEQKEQLTEFQIPCFHRPLAWWLNTLIQSGFAIEELTEPQVSDELFRKHPHMQASRIIAEFLIIRASVVK
ncbi:class I SAM-dependent methyltransferase [bacterium]|nr:class I SAM-dependent methyltransferase [bacterium]